MSFESGAHDWASVFGQAWHSKRRSQMHRLPPRQQQLQGQRLDLSSSIANAGAPCVSPHDHPLFAP